MTSTAWLSCKCDSYKFTISTVAHRKKLRLSSITKVGRAYPIQMNINLASRVDGRLLASQLADFADDADGAVGELLEVLRIDARSRFGGHDSV
jgi:hypothetical protein